MNPILLLILIIGIALVSTAFVKSQSKCPPPKIIYKYVPRNTLDVQFGEDNSPSEIYKDMFLKSNIWIGGYNLGDKTTILDELKSKPPTSQQQPPPLQQSTPPQLSPQQPQQELPQLPQQPQQELPQLPQLPQQPQQELPTA